jgi:hypothetical protein
MGSSAVGGIVGSILGRQASPRWANSLSFAIGAGLLLALPVVGAQAAVAVLIGCGLCLGWTSPMVVALGQRLVPGAAAVASALLLGVSWFLGGPLAPILFETVHGARGTAWAVSLLAGASLLAALFALGLRPEAEVGGPGRALPSPEEVA